MRKLLCSLYGYWQFGVGEGISLQRKKRDPFERFEISQSKR